ncbi:MAG: PEP-CTERM sorting domain-containing protein [Methanoregulaceae archaeon]|nr:PEP-CTERM sorting domain-containing protein [Methanoregulaceae archaeon]
MKRLIILAALAVPVASHALVLNANQTSNNGTGGIFMDLTPTTSDLLVSGFDTMFGSAAGSAVQIQVYTRPGTYVGFQGSNVGWTLLETANAVSNGTLTMAGISLTNSIYLTAGQTTGVYLHSITTGGGIRYFGTGTTSNTNFANADLALFSAHSRTGAVAFAGTMFTPRALTGNVYYTAVPEPATMAALGIGVAAMLRRRRRA